MIDSRFHKQHKTITLAQVYELLSVSLPPGIDKDRVFTNVSTLKDGESSSIVLYHNPKYRTEAAETHAGLCITAEATAAHVAKGVIILAHPKPQRAYALIAQYLYAASAAQPFIHPTAVVATTAVLGQGCSIGAYAVIGEHVELGDGVVIDSHTIIHDHVKIGKNGRIASQVTISHSIIGDRVMIKPGTRIGQQGFGFHMDEAGHFDVPQLGIVIIGNDVQIGANACIDRGSLDNTIIGNGVRIDNLVQIAHNVYIGDQSVIVAQAGIAGSSHLGRFVIVAGQVGIAGHLNIGNGVKIAAQSGLMRDVTDGDTVAGSPAVPVRDWHKQTIALQRLIREKKHAK